MRLFLAAALLLGTAPALAEQPQAAKPAKGSPEEIVCHREVMTGTLAWYRKTCMSRAAWQRQSDNNQNATQELDERGRINACTMPGGCGGGRTG